jgi:hypothetical protein
MVEADSHLKLLPPSMLDVYKVFEHIDMLSICTVNWHTVAASTWRNHRLPSPTRINLEEPARVTQHNQD